MECKRLLYVCAFVASTITCCVTVSVPYVEKYFDQTLDHFNFHFQPDGVSSFKQRYLVQDKWWDGKTGPIFFYTGNEGSIEAFWNNTGFVFDIAPQFQALVIFAEHRFYGKSLPFGPAKSFRHPYVDVLTAEQAMADYALLVTSLKVTLKATRSPVIAFGGSYGGQLSAYMRFKYPNVIDGSLAASAPLALVAGQASRANFFQDVTKDFRDAATGCEESVREAFNQMQPLAATAAGLEALSNAFNLCKPMKTPADYRHLLGWISNSFASLAMFDYPYPTHFSTSLPAWPIKEACRKLKTARVPYVGLAEAAGMMYGGPQCHDMWQEYVACSDPTGCGTGPSGYAWDYQACTEFMMPDGPNNVTDMFPPQPFTIRQRRDYCQKRWGLTPRDDWVKVNLWGKDIKSASNIFLSNGNLDPWHRGGILESVSESVVAMTIDKGAHHLDLRASNVADPDSVVKVRKAEVAHITKWIEQARRRQRNED